MDNPHQVEIELAQEEAGVMQDPGLPELWQSNLDVFRAVADHLGATLEVSQEAQPYEDDEGYDVVFITWPSGRSIELSIQATFYRGREDELPGWERG